MLPLCLPACFASCCLLVAQDYKSGKMMSGEIKAKLIDVLNEIIANHNAPRGAQNWGINRDAYYSSMGAPVLLVWLVWVWCAAPSL